jgi:hypothetical protein
MISLILLVGSELSRSFDRATLSCATELVCALARVHDLRQRWCGKWLCRPSHSPSTPRLLGNASLSLVARTGSLAIFCLALLFASLAAFTKLKGQALVLVVFLRDALGGMASLRTGHVLAVAFAFDRPRGTTLPGAIGSSTRQNFRSWMKTL